LRIEAVDKRHDCAGFNCGTEALDHHLRQQARQDADEPARELLRYRQRPVTLIGRLAVDDRAKGRGCASLLLMDALRRSLTHSVEVAAMAVIVDAKDDAAAGF
jgi:GNAT superfamily N-acetyltransferase